MHKLIWGMCIFIGLNLTVEPLTVAVMDIEVTGKDYKQTAGEEIVDLLNAFLSLQDDVKIVERKKLNQLLSEQASSEAGFTDEKARVKVQKLLGVQHFISGRLFEVGSKSYLSVNIIDTETSLKKTVLAKASGRDSYTILAETAGEKLLEIMIEIGNRDKPTKELTPSEKITVEVKGLKLPKVAVYISEMHISQTLPDPAAQFEMIEILRDAGFEVIEYKSSIKSDLYTDGVKEITNDLKGVDVVILGEGISEFALRRAELISCKARLEVNALQKSDEKNLALRSITASGVDVTESVAAKEALQNCSKKVAAKFIIEMVKKWNDQ